LRANRWETIRLVVTSASPGYKKLRINGSFNSKRREVHVPAEIDAPGLGDLIEVRGVVRKGEYGLILDASNWKLCCVDEHDIFQFLRKQRTNQVQGLGSQKLNKLEMHFNRDPHRFLDALVCSDSTELEGIIGKSLADRLIEFWQSYKTENELILALMHLGLSFKSAHSALTVFGESSVKRIENDPFELVPIVGFDASDEIAKSLKLPMNDRRRISALSNEILLNYQEQTASSLMHRDKFVEQAECYQVDGELALSIGIETKAIIFDSGYITNPAFYEMETSIRQFLTKINASRSIRFHDYEITRKLELFKTINRIALTQEQDIAVHLALNNNVSCITGGAGVGKTEVINAISWIYKSLTGFNVIGTALSGIAVDRIIEATGNSEAYTLAKLRYGVSNGDIKVLPDTLLVVDESSMLGVQELYYISKLRLDKLKLVFVGDRNQLSAVGYGRFFEQAISYFPTAKLTKVFRAESDEIANAANTILAGFKPSPNRHVDIIKPNLDDIAAYTLIHGAMALCPTNATASKLNRLIQSLRVKSGFSIFTFLGNKIYSNDRLLFTKNNHKLGILNGHFGIFVKHDAEGIHLNMERIGSITLSYDDFVNSGPQLGYAVTGHKSQGAGFDIVVVVCENSSVCTKRWLYTAFTRAKKKIAFAELGDIQFALNKPDKPRMTQRLVPLVE
jgi:exodeoxyribonuclease V alpha subunit